MSKRNIYLLAIGVITVFCIIIGSVIHLGNRNFFSGDFGEEGDFSDYVVLEDFDSISITGKVLEVKIMEGDVPSFKVSSNKERLIPDVKLNDSQLVIKQDNIGKFHGNSNCKIFITIPNYLSLKELDIEINVGEIYISNISSDCIHVTTNVGELEFEDINFQELEGESNVGEIKLDFANVLNDFNISLSTNVGEVIVDGEKFKKSYNQKGSTSKRIRLCTNVGEIKIK